jgi:hypothetical protein
MACQAATERAWLSIARFYDNCKSNKSGKKDSQNFKKIIVRLNTRLQDGHCILQNDVLPLLIKKV